jgi:hypothetical protein
MMQEWRSRRAHLRLLVVLVTGALFVPALAGAAPVPARSSAERVARGSAFDLAASTRALVFSESIDQECQPGVRGGRVRTLSLATAELTTVYAECRSDPRFLLVDEARGWLYVLDAERDAVRRFTLSGDARGSVPARGLSAGVAPAIDPSGAVYFVDAQGLKRLVGLEAKVLRPQPRPTADEYWRFAPAAEIAAVTTDERYVFWIQLDRQSGQGDLRRARRADGSGEVVMSPVQTRPSGPVPLTTDATQVLWAEGAVVRRMPKTGGASARLTSGGGSPVTALVTYDLFAYFTDLAGRILRVPTTGGVVQNLGWRRQEPAPSAFPGAGALRVSADAVQFRAQDGIYRVARPHGTDVKPPA